MPELYLGPSTFRFEQIVIERIVKPEKPGNYALGIKDEAGEFVPKYIGRSDADLRRELINRLADHKYPYFKFSLAGPRYAFEMECAQFHGFRGQLDNRDHPSSPQGSALRCFLCGL